VPSHSVSSGTPTSRLSSALAQDRIGAWGIALAIGSSVAPFTVGGGLIVTALAVTGQPGIAIGIVAVGLLLLLFARGYLAMARQIKNAGAFYAFAARSLSKPVAVSVALIAMLTYGFFLNGGYGGFGAMVSIVASEAIGIDVAWWIAALVAWVIIAVLGVLDLTVSEKILGFLVGVETVALLVYCVAIAAAPGFTWSFEPVALSNLWGPGGGALLAIGFTCFAGLEASAAYAEEARDADRNVRLATNGVLIAALAIYAFAATVIFSAASSVAATAGTNVYADAGEQGPVLFFSLAAEQLGGWAVTGGFALFAGSMLAAGIAFQNLNARYTFALGRENVLPRRFGTTVRGVPFYASIVQSVISLTMIIVFAVAGWDPLTQFFFVFGTSGGVGVAILITITAAAVIAFFRRDGHGEHVWARTIAPWLALPGLAVVLYLMLTNLPALYATEGWAGPSVLVPAAFAIVAVVGLVWGWTLRSIRPDVYQGIGLGSTAATAPSAPPAGQHAAWVGSGR
jgi:amino acid transporter